MTPKGKSSKTPKPSPAPGPAAAPGAPRHPAERGVRLLGAVAAALACTPELEETFQRALHETLGLMRADGGALWLLDGGGCLSLVAERGLSPNLRRHLGALCDAEVTGDLQRKPVFVPDLAVHPMARRLGAHLVRQERLRSFAAVPLRSGDRTLGVLAVLTQGQRRLQARGMDFLDSVGHLVGVTLENARLHQQTRERAEQLDALIQIGRMVNSTLDLDAVLQAIAEAGAKLVGATVCCLHLLDEEARLLRTTCGWGTRGEAWRTLVLHVGEGIVGTCAATGEALIVPDLRLDPRSARRDVDEAEGARSMLAIPLKSKGRVIGVLGATKDQPDWFREEHLRLLSTFADQAALALENARLYGSVVEYSERLEQMVARRTEELSRQKRFAEGVYQALPLGLYVVDRGLNVVACNQAGERELGFPAGALAGRNLLDLLPEEKRASARAYLLEIFQEGKVKQSEEEFLEAGAPRILRFTRAPLRDPDGTVGHAILLMEDITERRRLERQVLLSEKLAAVGRLAAGVAHELNNPLATIAGCAEGLLERLTGPPFAAVGGSEDFREYLTLIEEEAYRCKEITGGLLQFVREPGTARQPTDANLLVEKTLAALGHQPRIRAFAVEKSLAPDLPLLDANEGQLRQVILALLVNALDASGEAGTLAVRTLRLREEDGEKVAIDVEDRGPGIPEEDLGKIFEPFFTTKGPGKGTGLGLAIAHSIVSEHGGRIDVHSRVGEGTRFRVILPVRREGEHGPATHPGPGR